MILKYPFIYKDKTIDEIVLQRPKARDLLKMESSGKQGLASTAMMLSRLSGLPEEALGDLDAEDLMALSEEIGAFFPKPPPQDGGSL